MTDVLNENIGKICFVYLDDILIFSKSAEEHEQHVIKIQTRLHAYGLQVKSLKCEFFQKEITFLGHTVSQRVIKPCERNVNKVLSAQTPKTARQVVSFVALASQKIHKGLFAHSQTIKRVRSS